MAEGPTSINLPQIIAVALVSFFAIRWLITKSSAAGGSATTTTSSSSSGRGQAVDLAKISQVSAMFPQLDRRTIAWDLHRNGGSVAATTERVLGARGLDVPPPSYQPDLPSPVVAQVPAGLQGGEGGRKGGRGWPDLITRYGLQGKVGGKGKEAVPSEEQRRNAWSTDKVARAEMLRKRREVMVLEARKRMLAKTMVE